MAKLVYVNWRTGDDANDGLSSGNAKRTILAARAATAAATASTSASPDLVLIAPGVYFESAQRTNGNAANVSLFEAATDTNVTYASDGTGEVIVDFQNQVPFVDGFSGICAYWRFEVAVNFVGISFRNFVSHAIAGGSSGPTTRSAYVFYDTRTTAGPFGRLMNCVFYQRDGLANSGRVARNFNAENCSFYNLIEGIALSFTTGTIEAFGNYFKSVTTPFSGTAPTSKNYNAYPGNTGEANGLNTSSANTDVGFRDAANDDLRLDPVTDTVAWNKYLTLGRYGGRIGATGKGGPFYRYEIASLRMITTVPASAWIAWANDSSYTSGGVLGTVIQDATTGELKIDLVSVPTATDARARSGVYDLGAGGSPNLATVSVGRQETLSAGSALDTNTTLPQKWEYRSSNTSFALGDASPSWTEIEDDAYINVSHRYAQFRVTFVTNHTNA